VLQLAAAAAPEKLALGLNAVWRRLKDIDADGFDVVRVRVLDFRFDEFSRGSVEHEGDATVFHAGEAGSAKDEGFDAKRDAFARLVR